MSYEKLKTNIKKVVSNKGDDDIINTLVFLKEGIQNINNIASKLNISFEQLKKASDKNQTTEFNTDSVFANIDNLIEFEKEDDIISSLITLSSVLSETEAVLEDTPFEIGMVYKSLKFETPDEKPAEKVEEPKEEPKEEPVKEEKPKKTPAKKTPVAKKETPKKEEKPKEDTSEEVESQDLVF